MPGAGLGPGQGRKIPIIKAWPDLVQHAKESAGEGASCSLSILLSTYCMLSTGGRSSHRISKIQPLPLRSGGLKTEEQVSWTLKEVRVSEKVLGRGVQQGRGLGSEDRNKMGRREAWQWDMRWGRTRSWNVFSARLKI